MLGRKKRKKIENLKKVLQEHKDDCAYWYCQGNAEQYNICHLRAALTARKIQLLRG